LNIDYLVSHSEQSMLRGEVVVSDIEIAQRADLRRISKVAKVKDLAAFREANRCWREIFVMSLQDS
jgi:hypothetical protein